jgi:uncharacterized membrane protein YedE/YeeE
MGFVDPARLVVVRYPITVASWWCLGRLAPRSPVAVLVFMAAGVFTASLLRYWPLRIANRRGWRRLGR